MFLIKMPPFGLKKRCYLLDYRMLMTEDSAELDYTGLLLQCDDSRKAVFYASKVGGAFIR
jgi:hypothetical protein